MSRLLSITLCLVACLLTIGTAIAEEHTNNFEFSIAGSVQAFVYNDQTVYLLNLPFRIGHFVTPKLLLETEGIITAQDNTITREKIRVGYIWSLNGSYNIQATDQLMPFFLLGVGFTNSSPRAYFGLQDMSVHLINAGAGTKIFFSPKAALRIEYRLQDFEGRATASHWWKGYYTQIIDYTVHSAFFGVSLFF